MKIGVRAMLCTMVAGMLCCVVARAAPPGPRDPDWPCFQAKVSELSPAAMWTGPPIDAAMKTWSQDEPVSTLVGRLVQRRLPLDEARAEIAAFDAGAADRRDRLLLLFAGVFDALNQERDAVQAGLDRYGRRQKQLAAALRGEIDSLHAEQDAAQPDQSKLDDLVNRVGWDTRVFEARRQSISAACDVPNVIEQRLYALAQAVQQQLDVPATH